MGLGGGWVGLGWDCGGIGERAWGGLGWGFGVGAKTFSIMGFTATSSMRSSMRCLRSIFCFLAWMLCLDV